MIGDGAVAVGLARALAAEGSAVLASARPQRGPFLWRQADLSSGKGVKQAVDGADRVYVVLGSHTRCDGVFLVLRSQDVGGVVTVPLGTSAPAAYQDCVQLSLVHHGPVWGPDESLVATWAAQVIRGDRLWMADPGVIAPVREDVVVQAATAAAERDRVHWTVTGERKLRLPQLAAEIATGLNRPLRQRRAPLSWALRRAGVEVGTVREWMATPRGSHRRRRLGAHTR